MAPVIILSTVSMWGKDIAYVTGSVVTTFMDVLSFQLHKNPLRSPGVVNSFALLIKTVRSRARIEPQKLESILAFHLLTGQ